MTEKKNRTIWIYKENHVLFLIIFRIMQNYRVI